MTYRTAMRVSGGVATLIVMASLIGLMPSTVLATSPWWQVSVGSLPAYLSPGGTGKIIVTVTNIGEAPVEAANIPVAITDTLPTGLEATAISGVAGVGLRAGAGVELEKCSPGSVDCIKFAGTLYANQHLEVQVTVKIAANAQSGEKVTATVTGGQLPEVSASHLTRLSRLPTPFGVEDYELNPENEGGSLDTQAGSHPFQVTSILLFNEIEELFLGRFPEFGVPALPKDINVSLPPGLIGNPTPFPECTNAEFHTPRGAANGCPAETAIGVAMVTVDEPFYIGEATLPVPIFNLTPEVGEPARFGLWVQDVPVVLDTAVQTGGGYGVLIGSRDISEIQSLLASRLTFWGVPGDWHHDTSRGWGCVGGGYWHSIEPGKVPSCDSPKLSLQTPLLTLPTSCTGPLRTLVELDSWADPGQFTEPLGDLSSESLDGCARLGINPEIKVAPDVQSASTPTGLTVDLHIPQDEGLVPTGLAESDAKSVTVALPEGVTVSPAAADGLLACTDVAESGRLEGEIALNSAEAVTCPNASKVATVTIKTPLLPDPLEGAFYLAAQNLNPFGSLLAMYVVAEDPKAGVLVKLAGEARLNETTGQLVSKFETPQLPFEDGIFHFFGGARSPRSYATCARRWRRRTWV